MISIHACILIFLLFLNTAIAQDKQQLQQLLQPFSEIKQIKLNYQEKRFSLFFKQPRLYQGYIEYISPDTFIKQVQTPITKKIVIRKNKLTLYRYNTKADINTQKIDKKIVSLDDYPQFKQFKALFNGLFQGDASKLTKYYQYEIKVLAEDRTQLLLKTLSTDPFTQGSQYTSSINQQINIMFEHHAISKITMTGFAGERSELTFEQAE